MANRRVLEAARSERDVTAQALEQCRAQCEADAEDMVSSRQRVDTLEGEWAEVEATGASMAQLEADMAASAAWVEEASDGLEVATPATMSSVYVRWKQQRQMQEQREAFEAELAAQRQSLEAELEAQWQAMDAKLQEQTRRNDELQAELESQRQASHRIVQLAGRGVPAEKGPALIEAARLGRSEAVGFLLGAGAEVNAQEGESGRTALWWAARNGHEASLQLLLEAGAMTGCKDRQGRTALWWAASCGHMGCTRLLLGAGADRESRDAAGRSILWWAIAHGHAGCARLLVEAGADMEATDADGHTALYWSARCGNAECVRLLLEAGADFGIRDEHGREALWWAASGGHEEATRALLQAGADRSGGSYPESALEAARRGEHKPVVMLLSLRYSPVKAQARPTSWEQ